MPHNPNGRILYKGPSILDGAPIVVIATGFADRSANTKTGDMIQTWILRSDIPPHVAFKNEAGRSVCGNCPHGGTRNATCYILWFQGPLAVWNCWHHGAGYALATLSDFNGVHLRMGSAGDPAAVPREIWEAILPRTIGHTGYTHQWRFPVGQWLKGIVQASCDCLLDLEHAREAGWRTFSVRPIGSLDPAGTAHCAASAERGKSTDCHTCGLCDGASADVVIWAHGKRKAAVLA